MPSTDSFPQKATAKLLIIFHMASMLHSLFSVKMSK